LHWTPSVASQRRSGPPWRRLAGSAAAAALAVAALPSLALADPTVTFRYASYSPNVVRVNPGQAVTWTGDPGQTFGINSHPLRFADPSIAPQSDTSNSTTRTFTRIGRFKFFCANHQQFNMTGAVLVTANHAPSAHFNAPSSATTGVPVSFDASGSSDPDPGQSLTYSWDFDGDGTTDHTDTAPGASFSYTHAGTYTVTLKVTDNNAEPDIGPDSATTTRQITVTGATVAPAAGALGVAGAPDATGDETVTDLGVVGDDDVSVRVAGSTRSRSVRARGLAIRLTATERATATATLTVHSHTIGRAKVRLRAHGPRVLRVKLNRRGHALLARHARVRARLHVVLDDADGTGTTATRVITLRR